jgi:glycosyltransferase-like protein LARGE
MKLLSFRRLCRIIRINRLLKDVLFVFIVFGTVLFFHWKETSKPSRHAVLFNATGFSWIEKDDGISVGKVLHYKTLPRFTTFGSHEPVHGGICLFTQLSLDRIENLVELAGSWQHSISVAIYIESVEDSRKLHNELERVRNALQGHLESTARIDISLLYSHQFDADMDQVQNPYDFLYPINALRNLALDGCQAEYVLSMDADFIISADAYSSIRSVLEMPSIANDKRRQAFVLPAFEWINKVEKIPRYMDFDQLRVYCSRGRILPFHSKRFERARYEPKDLYEWCYGLISVPKHFRITRIQNLTDYPRWLKSDSPYSVEKQENAVDSYYEPYYVTKRSHMIRFDERFRGYGFNKRVNTMAMQNSNFEFIVLPKVYALHRYHPISISKQNLGQSDLISNIVGRTFSEFKLELKKE